MFRITLILLAMLTTLSFARVFQESFEYSDIADMKANGWTMYGELVDGGAALNAQPAPAHGSQVLYIPGNKKGTISKSFFNIEQKGLVFTAKWYIDDGSGKMQGGSGGFILRGSEWAQAVSIVRHESGSKYLKLRLGSNWYDTSLTFEQGWNDVKVTYSKNGVVQVFLNDNLAKTFTGNAGFKAVQVFRDWTTHLDRAVVVDDLRVEENYIEGFHESFEYSDIVEMKAANWLISDALLPYVDILTTPTAYDGEKSFFLSGATTGNIARPLFVADKNNITFRAQWYIDDTAQIDGGSGGFILRAKSWDDSITITRKEFSTKWIGLRLGSSWYEDTTVFFEQGWNEVKVVYDKSNRANIFLNDSLVKTYTGVAGFYQIDVFRNWNTHTYRSVVVDDIRVTENGCLPEELCFDLEPVNNAHSVAVDTELSWQWCEDALSATVYMKKVLKGDISGDNTVNQSDLNKFLNCYLGNISDSFEGDINDDGAVNLLDFVVIAREWQLSSELDEVATIDYQGLNSSYRYAYTPIGLEEDCQYIWRVDTTTADGIQTGDQRRFTTVGASFKNMGMKSFIRQYPAVVEKIFDNIDLTLPALSEVNTAVAAGNYEKACRELLDYYDSSSSGSWLRDVTYDSLEPNYIVLADNVVNNDIYRCNNLDGAIPRLSNGGLDWTYKGPTNDNEWAYTLNRMQYMAYLKYAYILTEDSKYLQRIDMDARDWVLNSPYPFGLSIPQWRGLEVAIRIPYLASHFYEFIGNDSVSDITRLLILSTLADHIHYLRNYHQGGGNWVITEMRGLASISACWPELENSDSLFNYAISKVEPQLTEQVLADGIQFEQASNYHNVVRNEFESFAIYAGYADKTISQTFLDTLESMWDYTAKSMRPWGGLPFNGDSDLQNYRSSIVSASERYGRDDWLYIATNGAEGVEPSGEPSVFYPWAGQLVSRSGWDADAHWSFFDIGPHGEGGHYHLDTMHLSVSAYGRDLLMDSGRFSYTGDIATLYRLYALGTASHNVVRIAGLNQALGIRQNTSPQTDDCEITTSYDFAKVSLPNGYTGGNGTITQQRLMRYERGKYWVVVDKMATDQAQDIEGLWHWNPDCTVVVDGLQSFSNDAGLGNLRIVPIGNMNWTLNLVEGQFNPTQGWISKSYNTYESNPVSVYTASIPAGETVFAWILIPGLGTPEQMSAEIISSDSTSVTIKVTESLGVENTIVMEY